MSEPFLGQITCLACNFPPYQWAFCQGQILPIQQYSALFSLLGTQFGGNGTSNFGLPDLQGRVPVGQGQLIGGEDYIIGEQGGVENVSLTTATIPPHNHALPAFTSPANAKAPAVGALTAEGAAGGGHGGGATLNIYNTGTVSVALQAKQVGQATGSNLPHPNMQPSIALNWCIALFGVFPTRG